MKVRFCEHNKGKSRVFQRLRKEFPQLDVKVKDCIKQCGTCHKALFATVDGKVVCGIDGEDLYRKIVKELESHNRKGPGSS